jgi:hypothetical protein
VRGFRPSRYGEYEESEDIRQTKESRLRTYARRARSGLPLFDDASFAERGMNYARQGLRQA